MTQQTPAASDALWIKPKPLLLLMQWLGCMAAMPFMIALSTQTTLAEVAAEPFSLDLEPVAPAEPPVVLEPEPEVFVAPAPEPEPAAIDPLPEPAIAAPAPSAQTEPATIGGDYIDTQNYNLGATPAAPYQAPSDVVLSDRSTGCEAVFATGQAAPGSLCDSSPARTVFLDQDNGYNGSPNAYATSAPGYEGSSVGLSGSISAFPIANAPGESSYPTQSGLSTFKPGTYRGQALRWLMPKGKQMLFPLPIPAPITSAFGWRLHPISGEWRMHTGTDLGAALGTPVLAAFAGKVALADVLGGYGLAVFLEHNQGQQETRYAHLSQIFVRPGQWVQQGTVIGLVGSTGNSTGPHLHFEMLQSTPEGMVAVDSGAQLQTSLAYLVKALQTARMNQPQTRG